MDIRNYQTARATTSIDNFKSKQLSVEKNSNILSIPLQTKKPEQNTNFFSKENRHQALKIGVKPELKRIAQNSSVGINKLAIQKKKNLTALKNKPTSQQANFQETSSALKSKPTMKVTNTQIHKPKPQENMVPARKTKVENSIPTLKNKAQENDVIGVQITKTKISTSVQDTQLHQNIQKTISPEVTQKINHATQENKPQVTQKDDKVLPVNLVEKQTEESNTKVSLEEKCELEPLLARAVEEELQDIMIQVWQELPDDPLDEGDRIAVDKLRNEAGDDLRRVLGLNITKRLLNVYNNLFLKMQFTCRPQMGCLTNFLNEYHIHKFKRIDKNSNTFAAQMENIEDFDKLCVLKEIMCGEAKVTVTPCYKFTVCPEKLKTIYDDTYFYDATAPENTESQKCNNIKQKVKVQSPSENVKTPTKKAENIDFQSPKKPDRSEIQNFANSIHNDANDVKKKFENIDATITDKLHETESHYIPKLVGVNTKEVKKYLENIDVKATNQSDRTEIQKTANLISKECKDVKNDLRVIYLKSNNPVNAEIQKNSVCSDSNAVKTDSSKLTDDNNKSKEKDIQDNVINTEVISKSKDITEYIVKDKLDSDDEDDVFASGIPECQMEGDDELNDEDILALMSEGVVLDECSGSED